MTQIYALAEPTGEIRYIGKAKSAEKRLKGHIKEAMHGRRMHYPVYRWLHKLISEGLQPRVEIIATVPDEQWPAYERAFIAKSIEDGDKLLNVAPGGDEPYCPRDVRAENGRRVAEARKNDPLKYKLWNFKRQVGMDLRAGVLSDNAKAKLRDLAQKYPQHFGRYANLY